MKLPECASSLIERTFDRILGYSEKETPNGVDVYRNGCIVYGFRQIRLSKEFLWNVAKNILMITEAERKSNINFSMSLKSLNCGDYDLVRLMSEKGLDYG